MNKNETSDNLFKKFQHLFNTFDVLLLSAFIIFVLETLI